MPTSKLSGAHSVWPRHGRHQSSRFSLATAAAEKAEAPRSNNTSPRISALTESKALATSMEMTHSFFRPTLQLFANFPPRRRQCPLSARSEPKQLIREWSEFFVQKNSPKAAAAAKDPRPDELKLSTLNLPHTIVLKQSIAL